MAIRRWLEITFVLLAIVAFGGGVRAQHPPAEAGGLDLTAEERRWLSQHHVIRFAADPDYQPIESIDENGHVVGISAAYLALLAKKLGLRFQSVPVANWDEAMSKAKSRQVDMLSAATQSAARSRFMLFTTPHIELPGVIIMRSGTGDISGLDELRGKRVGVVSSYVWQEWITRDYPDVKLHPVSDLQAGLLLLSFGQLDAMVGNLGDVPVDVEKLR